MSNSIREVKTCLQNLAYSILELLARMQSYVIAKAN